VPVFLGPGKNLNFSLLFGKNEFLKVVICEVLTSETDPNGLHSFKTASESVCNSGSTLGCAV
jgi:hypothetical protein